MRGDSRAIEAQQHGLRLDAADGEADEMRNSVDGVTELGDVGNRRRGCRQRVGEGSCVRRLAIERFAQFRGGRAEADDRRDVLETRASRPFLVAADEQRRQAQTAPYQQRP